VSVTLPAMPPAQEQAWQLLIRLDQARVPWVLIGGQMMMLLGAEHRVLLPRPTLDADVLVDVRARPGGLEVLARWLAGEGFDLAGVSPDNIGHRFVRPASPGPGNVSFDLLAPEGLGERARVFTVPPARTVSVPASSTLISSAVAVSVALASGAVGVVHRPTVLGALVGKAAATKIPVRDNRERDWHDAALLLSLLEDPLAARRTLTKGDRRHLRALGGLLNAENAAWAALPPDRRRLGLAAARLLLAAPDSR
jgi:hypothetical protein